MTPFFNKLDIDIDPNQFGLSADFFSEAWGICPSGDLIVGTVGETLRSAVGQPPPNLESGVFHGFLRFRTFATPEVRRFDFDNAAATSVVGCNDLHDIVGFFRDTQNQLHAFIRLNGSPAQVFDIKGFQAVTLPPQATPEGIHNGAYDINRDRLVVGAYHDRNANRGFGFVAHAADPANPLRIDMRQELNNPAIEHTRITGINTQGDIVGSYLIGSESTSFKWKVVVNANRKINSVGVPTVINYPGTDVVVTGISDNVYIAGNDHAASVGNTTITGFFWRPDGSGTYIVDDDHLNNFQVNSPLPAGLMNRTFVGGVGGGSEIVGAYRKDAGNLLPNRRAFYGFFGDIVRWTFGPREIPFYPPIPFPFPPFPWSVPLFGSGVAANQEALLAYILLQVSYLTDTRIRQQLRAVILERYCEELKRLKECDEP